MLTISKLVFLDDWSGGCIYIQVLASSSHKNRILDTDNHPKQDPICLKPTNIRTYSTGQRPKRTVLYRPLPRGGMTITNIYTGLIILSHLKLYQGRFRRDKIILDASDLGSTPSK
jgi:hypothetical protein